ncbi:hypothetical protein BLOT_005633 [Blomia tropicalis]|nr:hypothetical protein BLOT_005633 [Blomia tropicalis]
MYGTANQNRFRSMYYGNQTYHVEQCMSKIIEVVQPCSQRAVNNWNLNHTMFVPSKMSTCCANWEVYDCFVQASLDNCNLLEFHALVQNMTYDALHLERSNCTRFRYRSEICEMYGGSMLFTGPCLSTIITIILVLFFFFPY